MQLSSTRAIGNLCPAAARKKVGQRKGARVIVRKTPLGKVR